MVKKSKIIRLLIFVNATLVFYLGISTNPNEILELLSQSDFYIKVIGSILFGLCMVWIFKKTLNRKK